MSFLDLFTGNKKKSDVKISQRQQNPLQNSAMAATFAEAGEHDTARSYLNEDQGRKTILVIGKGETFSEKLATYSISMAKRLDYNLMTVNITDAPLKMNGDKREQATLAFKEKCAASIALLQTKAAREGIEMSHQIEVGVQDEVIEKIHQQFPGMRYVLTEPDPEISKSSDSDISIPVFDLGSYQGASA